MHVRGVPEQLHKAVRHECVETRESIPAIVIEAVRRELERRGKPIAIDDDASDQ